MNSDLTPQKVQDFIQRWKVYRDDVSDPTFMTDAEIYSLQNKLLQRQMKRLAEGSKYYKKIFDQYGIDPLSIKTVDDLEKMPLTRKLDYVEDPDAFRLTFNVNKVENNLWELSYTAGTTSGKPSPFYVTVSSIMVIHPSGGVEYQVISPPSVSR